jgi:hypothetical protein
LEKIGRFISKNVWSHCSTLEIRLHWLNASNVLPIGQQLVDKYGNKNKKTFSDKK